MLFRSGITVHRPWQTFANFLRDMGPRPPNHTIARNNNDGDYAPGNCCWATRSEQARKRNIAHLVKIGRRTKCVADWCREFAIDQTTVTNRVHRRGWSWERALTEPVRKKTYDRVLTNANSLAT